MLRRSLIWLAFAIFAGIVPASAQIGPTPSPAMGQSWVLLNTLTPSSVASIADTTSVSATYSNYAIVFENVVPDTNAVNFHMTLHSGGSFQTSNYLNGISLATSYFDISTNSTVANTSGGGFSGFLLIYNLNSASVYKMGKVFGVEYNSSGGVTGTGATGCIWTSTDAVDGFSFQFNTGNIADGIIKIYGVK